jgi:hypothetical protein
MPDGYGGPAKRATTVVNRTKVQGVVPHFDVYIGRADRHQKPPRWEESEWHNPFPLPKGASPEARAAVIERYRTYLLTQRPDLVARLPELRGRVLGCWCTPEACHGDVLAELADEED